MLAEAQGKSSHAKSVRYSDDHDDQEGYEEYDVGMVCQN